MDDGKASQDGKYMERCGQRGESTDTGKQSYHGQEWRGKNGVGIRESSPNCTLVPGGTLSGEAGCDSELLKCGHSLSFYSGTLLPYKQENITSFTFTDLNSTQLRDNSCL